MSSEWSVNEQGKLRLVSAVEGVGDRKSLALGLEFKLQPGWKIYWRSPGDAGYPPRIDWDKSENVASAQFEWPVPERFSVLGLETLGYKNEVILPLKVEPAEPGKPVTLRADISYLTCDEICVPHQVQLGLDLPAAAAKPSDQANVLARYASLVPLEGPRQDLSIEAVSLASKGEEVVLKVKAAAAKPFARPDLYVEGPQGAFFTKPTVSFATDARSAVLTLTAGGVPHEEFEAAPLRLTLVDNGRAMEHVVSVRLGEGTVPSVGFGGLLGAQSILTIIVLALIGGLILNLMPCVFPVLFIKALGFVQHAHGHPGEVRRHGLIFLAGVLASFALIGGALVGLQAAGQTIGWGAQLQQPLFVAALALLMFAIGLNLLGVFEIGTSVQGVGGGLAARSGDVGAFSTGVLAVVVATPCTAPFMAAALGFAFQQPAGVAMAVFLALGLGLAAPFAALSFAPGLMRFLPKPGAWMDTLKQLFAFPMFATAVWLLWTLAQQAGANGVGAALLAMLGLGFVIWAFKTAGEGRSVLAWVGRAGSVALMLAALALVANVGAAGPGAAVTTQSSAVELDDEAWSPEKVAALRAEGRSVFVDFTAAWCITCQFNKRVALKTPAVQAAFAANDVTFLTADWTARDDVIAKELAAHGRSGVPLYLLYGPAGEPAVLPQVLTERIVVDAVDALGG
ncbi:MAG: thioredoxin family protein [Caulobacterales bacterium]|nr:thioredoxin family protein [Caulobacterales bacterium]